MSCTSPLSPFLLENPANGLISVFGILLIFKMVPTIIFCSSADNPCSCSGAGFELYKSFCNARGNITPAMIKSAKNEYVGIFDALGGDATMILISVGGGILIIIVFVFVRITIELSQINDAKAEAEKRAAELLERNIDIQNQLMMTQLNKEQKKAVSENKLAEHMHCYELEWETLVFEGRLGSGTFGDCFKGRKGDRPVAIKRMRSAFLDEKILKAFSREIEMLAMVGYFLVCLRHCVVVCCPVSFDQKCLIPFHLSA